MFFSISRLEEGAFHANELQNPQNKENPMVLGIYRTQSRTAFFTVRSKKVVAEFWDDVTRKKIPTKLWSSEMKAFAQQKINSTPKPSFIFKFTIVGWLFVAAIVCFFGYLVYDSIKPDAPKPATYISMEQAPQVGDIYFGRYEAFKQAGDRIASNLGFGWFKIINVQGDVYTLAKSTEISISYKPKEQMNNTSFETTGTTATITEHAGYMLNLKAEDGKMEIYLTDKK